jgi:hypothetical protein
VVRFLDDLFKVPSSFRAFAVRPFPRDFGQCFTRQAGGLFVVAE